MVAYFVLNHIVNPSYRNTFQSLSYKGSCILRVKSWFFADFITINIPANSSIQWQYRTRQHSCIVIFISQCLYFSCAFTKQRAPFRWGFFLTNNKKKICHEKEYYLELWNVLRIRYEACYDYLFPYTWLSLCYACKSDVGVVIFACCSTS